MAWLKKANLGLQEIKEKAQTEIKDPKSFEKLLWELGTYGNTGGYFFNETKEPNPQTNKYPRATDKDLETLGYDLIKIYNERFKDIKDKPVLANPWSIPEDMERVTE